MSSPPGTAPTTLSKLASKRKNKKKHFVQQKVEVLRASDPILSILMWGVNHSVGVFPPPSPLLHIHPPTHPTATFDSSVYPLGHAQINDLSQVPVPVMLLPDDFRASTKIKVNNHLFNKYGDCCACRGGPSLCTLSVCTLLISACRPLSGTAIHFCTNNGRFYATTITTNPSPTPQKRWRK